MTQDLGRVTRQECWWKGSDAWHILKQYSVHIELNGNIGLRQMTRGTGLAVLQRVDTNSQYFNRSAPQFREGGRVEACPFAGIIQIKFNGNFSERIMPKQSSNTRHAHTYNLRQPTSLHVSKLNPSHSTELLSFLTSNYIS
jgi:hypothetical protein